MRPKVLSPLEMKQSGSVVVEATIALPLLFLIFAAVVQFGYALSVRMALQNASLVGARVAVLSAGKTSAEVCEAARNAVASVVNPERLECETVPTSLPAAEDTKVTVALTYPLPVLWEGGFIAESELFTVRGQTTMQ